MASPPSSRPVLVRARPWRGFALALVLGGIVGALWTARAMGPAHEDADGPRDLPQAPASSGPVVGGRAPLRGGAGREPPRPGATRRVRLQVVGNGGGEPEVAVRVLERVPEETCFRSLSNTVRTDAGGWASLFVAPDTPSDAVVEVARGGVDGFRHGFLPWAEVLRADGEPARVRLPLGGVLHVVVEGLPPASRPAYVSVEFLSPYAECEELFRDVSVSPSEDGGIFEVHPSWRRLRVPLSPDGTARVAHVPSDHAVTVLLPTVPEGWLVEETSSTGPLLLGRDADLLRVPEGAEATYRLRLVRAPYWRVRVRDAGGTPVPGANVASGVTNRDGSRRLLGHTATTDARGEVDLPLWTGARIPEWTPEGLVLLSWAPGHAAALLEAPGTWQPGPAEIALGSPVEGAFVLEGRVFHGDERPGAGLPLRLGAAAPWNLQAVIEGFATTTDGDGNFRFEVPEDLRPLFAAGPGLRVYLDVERLEAMASDAFWRMRWPHLPRARLVPDEIVLPELRGRARTVLRVRAP